MSHYGDETNEKDLYSYSNDHVEDNSSQSDPWSLTALNLPTGDNANDMYSTSGGLENNNDADYFKPEKKKTKQQVKLKADDKKTTPKKPKEKEKKKRSVGSVIGRAIISILLVLIITVSLVGGSFAVYVFSFVDDEIPYDLNKLELQYTTMVYAQDKSTGEYYELLSLHGQQNRIWVDLDECSPYIADAIVSLEDKRFYDHDGVDWKRTFSAFANMFFDIYGGVQGGSTITQQLVKNLTGDDEQTSMRKIQEIVRARRLERDYDKNTILECYINTVHFGNGCDGIETAAHYYFGKDAKSLTLAECASLAATIQSPSVINPLDDPQSNRERMEVCLDEMLDQGFITEAERESALVQKLNVIGLESETKETEEVYSYFEDALIEQVINDLVEQKDMNREDASKMVVSGGLRIYSTFDKDIQAELDDTYQTDHLFPDYYDGIRPQSASTIMDYQGHILAMVGGRGDKVNMGLNRATQSTRQPGSSIKPLAGYAPSLEANLITYSSHVLDSHLLLDDGTYYPQEYGSGSSVTAWYALENSLNCPAVRIVNMLGVDKSFEFAKNKFHLSTLVAEETTDSGLVTDKTLASLGLGGMLYGVHVSEMTAAYATFGNLGVYWKPTTYTIVYDTFGNVVLEQEEHGQQVMGADTANIMNEMLQTVLTGGTATSAQFGSWPIFGKTGTTDDNHDRWFVGGTPYYVSAVWMGYDDTYDMPSWSNGALAVWRATMRPLHDDLELCDFRESDDVVCYKYCSSTGDIASTSCSQGGLGYYKESYTPLCHHGYDYSEEQYKPSPVGGDYVKVKEIVKPDADAAEKSIDKQKAAKKETVE